MHHGRKSGSRRFEWQGLATSRRANRGFNAAQVHVSTIEYALVGQCSTLVNRALTFLDVSGNSIGSRSPESQEEYDRYGYYVPDTTGVVALSDAIKYCT